MIDNSSSREMPSLKSTSSSCLSNARPSSAILSLTITFFLSTCHSPSKQMPIAYVGLVWLAGLFLARSLIPLDNENGSGLSPEPPEQPVNPTRVYSPGGQCGKSHYPDAVVLPPVQY